MKVVVFVDVQKDFIGGALRNEKAIEVMPKIVEFAQDCVKNGYKLYATRDTHEATRYYTNNNFDMPKLKEFSANPDNFNCKPLLRTGYLSTLEGQKLPVEHCIEMTDGWMIDDRLMEVIDGRATIVNKPTFGSFDLAEIIEEDFSYETADGQPHKFHPEDIEEIVICGFCTSICCLANAVILRAKFPNIKITVMKDLCACVTDESHNAALKVFEMQQIDVV